ncbi:MAG: hypothetical protein K9N11_06695 [Lentisphaeria bacterium]|nr:hypothetical protein [Candidatus Neomarinimicrobiota bacterium]MCF7842523.1 hypothetical protein [Lentisphaeria bacterium]
MNQNIAIISIASLLLSACATLLGPSAKPGIDLAQQGDYDAAMQYYQQIIEAGEANGKIYRHAYEAAFNLEAFDEADELYAAAIEAGFSPDSMRSLAVELWYNRAKTALGQEHWQTATYAAGRIKEIAPESKPDKFCQHMLQGKALYDKGSTRQLWDAVGEFTLAANHDEKSGLPYLWLGRTRYKNDRMNYDAALQEYDKALEIEPGSVWSQTAREESEKIRAVRDKMKSFWGS